LLVASPGRTLALCLAAARPAVLAIFLPRRQRLSAPGSASATASPATATARFHGIGHHDVEHEDVCPGFDRRNHG